MEYRSMDKLSVTPSLLGFGCMRFPLNTDGSIQESESEKMIDYAMENGVNYIDTAYPYHNGDSEPFLGRILKKYNRNSYYLATKLPVWKVQTLEDVKTIYQEQLDRLDTSYVDFYLLHALNKERWQRVKDLGILSYCEELQRMGKIKYLGFSFHDQYPVFEDIINGYQWDFCQIQYNYLDTREQAGDKGYKLAEEKGIPLVIMEPVKGGSLANLPQDISKRFQDYAPEASISSWAMRWIASKSNVKVVLSGMSTLEQVRDNISTYQDFSPLNDRELKIVEEVASDIRSRMKSRCTGCAYCMPCPVGVDIPKTFKIWNEHFMFHNAEKTRSRYQMMEDQEKPEACRQCGKCETACPQSLPIRKDLERAAADILKA